MLYSDTESERTDNLMEVCEVCLHVTATRWSTCAARGRHWERERFLVEMVFHTSYKADRIFTGRVVWKMLQQLKVDACLES